MGYFILYLLDDFHQYKIIVCWLCYCYISSFPFPVIGTAFALNMLFSIPIWIGVLLTGLSTLLLLALQQYGVFQDLHFSLFYLSCSNRVSMPCIDSSILTLENSSPVCSYSWLDVIISDNWTLDTLNRTLTPSLYSLCRLGSLNSWLHFLYWQLRFASSWSWAMQNLMWEKYFMAYLSLN